jgi:hypothetical protein
MSLLGNLVFFIFGGFLIFIGYVLGGLRISKVRSIGRISMLGLRFVGTKYYTRSEIMAGKSRAGLSVIPVALPAIGLLLTLGLIVIRGLSILSA